MRHRSAAHAGAGAPAARPRALDASFGTALGRVGRVLPVAPVSSRRDGRAHALVPRPLHGATRAEIAERARRTTTLLLCDRSGSMYVSGDPTDVCGAAAEGLIALQRRSGGGRAAVVPWGSSAPASMVTGPLDVRHDTKPLGTALREHTSLGGTDTAAALRRAGEIVAALGVAPASGSGRASGAGPTSAAEPASGAGRASGSSVVVYLLTDGCDDVGPGIRDAVAALPPGCVHALVIDRAGLLPQRTEAAWNTVGLGSFVRLDHLDVRAMTNQLVAAYAAALGLQDSPL